MISSADTEQLIQELAELRSERRWTERVREDLVHAAAADQHMRGSAERKRAWELNLRASGTKAKADFIIFKFNINIELLLRLRVQAASRDSC